MIRAADHVIDMGPGAGVHGGRVVAQGTPAQVAANPESLTGCLPVRAAARIAVPEHARANANATAQRPQVLRIVGRQRQQPEGRDGGLPGRACFTCVTGVSGSGKSTLVNDTLYAAVARHSPRPRRTGAARRDRRLWSISTRSSTSTRAHRPHAAQQPGHLHRPVHADPRADGRDLRRERGYGPGRFSFNVAGRPRCEVLPGRRRGQGRECTSCPTSTCPATSARASATTARRWRSSTRANIAQVLDMTVETPTSSSKAVPCAQAADAARRGPVLHPLGQSATTFGGEAQRVKLALELSARHRPHAVHPGRTRPPACTSPTSSLLLKVLHQLARRATPSW